MKEKEKMKETAKIFRECADIMEEISETEDQERSEELAAKYIVLLMKIETLG